MLKSLKSFVRKSKWFLHNYGDISFGKKLASPNAVIIESSVFHGPITYKTDSLVTSNSCDFINEPRFAKAYAAAAATNPWPGFTLQWRVYIVCWFADMVKKLEGDFVECGVNTGAYSRAVIEYIDFPRLKKTFYLFDTFAGLVPSQINDAEKNAGIENYLGKYHDVYEDVKKTFASFNVSIIKGMVPETLPRCQSEKIAYLSIDMNVVEPEIAAANYFWDKLVPGAVIILDDYGFPQHKEQKKAFDIFAKEKGVNILCLPTAQGIIFKP
jgi:O-methyltransferase